MKHPNLFTLAASWTSLPTCPATTSMHRLDGRLWHGRQLPGQPPTDTEFPGGTRFAVHEQQPHLDRWLQCFPTRRDRLRRLAHRLRGSCIRRVRRRRSSIAGTADGYPTPLLALYQDSLGQHQRVGRTRVRSNGQTRPGQASTSRPRLLSPWRFASRRPIHDPITLNAMAPVTPRNQRRRTAFCRPFVNDPDPEKHGAE